MKTQKITVETNNGSANYIKILSSEKHESYELEEINGNRFFRALRKASGFRGKNLEVRCDCYGKSIGNNTMSVYGKYTEYKI
jgi:hypothetical protein